MATDGELDTSIGLCWIMVSCAALCPEATSCIKDQGLLPVLGIDSAEKSNPDRLPAQPLATAIQASYDLQAVPSCPLPPVLSYCVCR